MSLQSIKLAESQNAWNEFREEAVAGLMNTLGRHPGIRRTLEVLALATIGVGTTTGCGPRNDITNVVAPVLNQPGLDFVLPEKFIALGDSAIVNLAFTDTDRLEVSAGYRQGVDHPAIQYDIGVTSPSGVIETNLPYVTLGTGTVSMAIVAYGKTPDEHTSRPDEMLVTKSDLGAAQRLDVSGKKIDATWLDLGYIAGSGNSLNIIVQRAGELPHEHNWSLEFRISDSDSSVISQPRDILYFTDGGVGDGFVNSLSNNRNALSSFGARSSFEAFSCHIPSGPSHKRLAVRAPDGPINVRSANAYIEP